MLQGWQKKTSILNNSWYSQISLAYIHFSNLFIWKAFQTYRCKNKNSTQTTHTPSPQICQICLLNICPVCHLLSFTCTFPYIHTHIHAILQSHPAPTCPHLKQTCACAHTRARAHTQTLTSSYTTHTALCWVLCGSLSKQPGGGEFCDEEKAKWGMLFGDGSTAPLPTSKA